MPIDIARGIRLGAVLLLLLFFLLGLLDFWFEWKRWEPVGSRLQRWAGHYPVLAMGFVVVVAVLVGHFFGH